MSDQSKMDRKLQWFFFLSLSLLRYSSAIYIWTAIIQFGGVKNVGMMRKSCIGIRNPIYTFRLDLHFKIVVLCSAVYVCMCVFAVCCIWKNNFWILFHMQCKRYQISILSFAKVCIKYTVEFNLFQQRSFRR